MLCCYKRQKKTEPHIQKQEAKTNRPSEMSTKSQYKKKSKDCARRWTKEEVEKFQEILSEPSNKYSVALEKLALKKSSNNKVFECVKKSFDDALQDSGFTESNERNNFMDKDKTVKPYKNI